MASGGYRKFKLLLYPDNPSHVSALDKLINYSYCYILHDKDVIEDDDNFDDLTDDHLKKAHYHVWVQLQFQKTISAFSKVLGIEQRFIRQCENDTKFILYMTHRENPNKYQYSVDEIQGTALSKVQAIYKKANMSEDDIVLDIINLIDSYNCYVTPRQFIIDVCSSGYYSEFRRNYYMFKDLYQDRMNIFVKRNDGHE